MRLSILWVRAEVTIKTLAVLYSHVCVHIIESGSVGAISEEVGSTHVITHFRMRVCTFCSLKIISIIKTGSVLKSILEGRERATDLVSSTNPIVTKQLQAVKKRDYMASLDQEPELSSTASNASSFTSDAASRSQQENTWYSYV